MTPDQINGAFEFGGSLVYLLNVRRLIRDKAVRGVSWIPQGFFTAWGVWNLYYYPNLNQWWSFSGGLCLVLINLVWTVLAIRYGGFNGKKVGGQ
jgi:hypothetical protein